MKLNSVLQGPTLMWLVCLVQASTTEISYKAVSSFSIKELYLWGLLNDK